MNSAINSDGASGRAKLTKSLSTPARRGSQKPTVVPYNRTLSRAQSIKEHISSGTANFFGVTDYPETTQQKWANRRLRHCSRLYGGVREVPSGHEEEFVDVIGQLPMTQIPSIQDPFARPRLRQSSMISGVSSVGRSMSMDSRGSRGGYRPVSSLTRRDSVARMAWDGFTTIVKSGSLKPRRQVSKKAKQHQTRSFAPASIAGDDSVFEAESAFAEVTPELATPHTATTTEAASMEPIQEVSIEEPEGGDNILATSTSVHPLSVAGRKKPPLQRQRTITRDSAAAVPETPLTDDVFFDLTPTSQSAHLHSFLYHPEAIPRSQQYQYHQVVPTVDEHRDGLRQRPLKMELPAVADDHFAAGIPKLYAARMESKERPAYEAQPSYPLGHRATRRKPKPKESKTFWSRILSRALSNADRRRYGEGIIGRCLGRTLRQNSELSPSVRQQLDTFDDHRPYFTYWVTSVQILVTIISLATYGFGPIGFSRTQKAALVLQSSLVLEQVAYYEQENFWIGPSHPDLVHLGAKYSPCMRRDLKIYKSIEENAIAENETACCIFNDGRGCVQTTRDQCLSYATWHKWDARKPGPNRRRAGSVCGQDPRACKSPASTAPFEWPDDLTQWPICEETNLDTDLKTMKCEMTGRPCCTGIQGECRITTREYCDFVKGYFHEEAVLCSQVSCMNEICGMIPFLNPKYPDQFYRLFTPIFLHAGIVHCMFTVLIQFFLMRDLEKLIGWFRMAVLYLVCGIAGNLASAIFVPYQAEVGPAGAQFGLMAGLVVDAIYSWKMIVRPWKAFAQLAGIVIFLFILGLLPWVDNWAHFFGFVFGLLLSFAFFPYIQFGSGDCHRRIIIVSISLFIAVGLFCMLILLFYVFPIWDCPNCAWFNCIPFTDHFCDNQGLELILMPPM